MFPFAEYDECSNPAEHGCEHECFNTLGGYSCQCRIGYELHSDEKRCESKYTLTCFSKLQKPKYTMVEWMDMSPIPIITLETILQSFSKN